MALAITDAPVGELLSVGDAKRSLRLFDDSMDDEIGASIIAARDYCERTTQRTLRQAVTRTLKQVDWWWDECYSSQYIGHHGHRHSSRRAGLYLPWPPLIAVTGITYYDQSNVSQTLATSNYNVEFSTDGGGRITWASSATIPSLYFRPDAVTVTFTTGYADLATLPPVALQAMKLAVEMLFKKDTTTAEMIQTAIGRLLSLVDWTGYA